jgi:hypothetical protein
VRDARGDGGRTGAVRGAVIFLERDRCREHDVESVLVIKEG